LLRLATVGDLLEHLPHRHEDRGDVKAIGELLTGEQATVAVEVRSISTFQARNRRGLRVTTAKVADATGPLEAVWFNQPWVERSVTQGVRVILHGRYEGRGRFRVSEHELGGSPSAGSSTGIVPVHPAADGLPARRIRDLVALSRAQCTEAVDALPGSVLASERLAIRADALDAIHFPVREEDFEIARRRLAFDELLVLQLDLMRRRSIRELEAPAIRLDPESQMRDRWLAGLPFEATADQLTAFAQITSDLASEVPMSRLLMGEVGSGKTVVALHALLTAVDSGAQGMLMAPTETLAGQHLRSIERLLDGLPIPFALLTGSTGAAQRRETLERFAAGELPLLIGTHALLEPDVTGPRVALCVVDEQHRFGVRQRERLARSGDGTQPHVLHMTATPIPRTMALAAYGDLETTVLKEMPLGRSPISTHLVSSEAARARAYERIREEISDGGRAFVVCPLVETSEALEAKAATEGHERLSTGPLAGLSVGLLHGRMNPAEKERAMLDFASGVTQVLVATTVIEVGIDVPEATVMLIENAERFGLAQLHQLRGRVGRGERPGLCLLCGPPESRRLSAMVASTDGFELAELDLELRGEGDLTGLRQSGLPSLRAATLPADLDLLERAHAVAGSLVEADPQLVDPLHVLLGDLVRSESALPGERLAA
jgi:ATP-dependent DNA helicase RecG